MASINAEQLVGETRAKGIRETLHRLGMMWRPYRIRFLDYQYRQAYLDLFWRALAGRSDLLLEVLDATSGSSPSTQYARSAFLDGLLAYEYADLHLGEEEAFLAEEDGFCRGISNVYGCYEGGDADQRISRYVSLCPPISALVYVNAAPDLAFRRRKTRDTGYQIGRASCRERV